MVDESDPLQNMGPADRAVFVDTGYSFGWLPDPPSQDDWSYAAGPLGAEQPNILPTSVDLRAGFPNPYDQGPSMACTANAIAGLLQFERKRQLLPDFVPSRLFIWWNTRSMEGNSNLNAGGYLRDAIKSCDVTGFCHEETWPYDLSKFREVPPQGAFEEALKYKAVDYFRLNNAAIDELKSCLAAGFPFAFGFTVYASFVKSETCGGVVPLPTNSDARLGGHAVVATGYDDAKQLFTVRSSWGDQKGDGGYYYFPYSYVSNSNMTSDFWTLRLVTNAALPSPENSRKYQG